MIAFPTFSPRAFLKGTDSIPMTDTEWALSVRAAATSIPRTTHTEKETRRCTWKSVALSQKLVQLHDKCVFFSNSRWSWSYRQTTFPQSRRSCCWPVVLCCWRPRASSGETRAWHLCLCSSSVWVYHARQQARCTFIKCHHMLNKQEKWVFTHLLPVAIKSFLYSILTPSSKVTDRVFTSIATT